MCSSRLFRFPVLDPFFRVVQLAFGLARVTISEGHAVIDGVEVPLDLVRDY